MINSVGSFAPQVTTVTQPGAAQAERGRQDVEARTREGEVAREAGKPQETAAPRETREASSRDVAPREDIKNASADKGDDIDPYSPRGSVIDVTV